MTESILSYNQADPIRFQCEIDLKKLPPAPKQRERFDKKWSALTTYQAPHKPFLLLSIMDLIAQGAITHNFIKPSFERVETFNPNTS